MNEKIDFIELVKRVKKGNAPKKIKVENRIYEFNENHTCINNMYCTTGGLFGGIYLLNLLNNFNTEIIILDNNCAIQELDPNDCYFKDGTELVYKEMYWKINEIIKYLRNKGDKE